MRRRIETNLDQANPKTKKKRLTKRQKQEQAAAAARLEDAKKAGSKDTVLDV